MIKNKKVITHTSDTQTTIFSSLSRTLIGNVCGSCFGYKVFGGIIYHLCNLFFLIGLIFQKLRILLGSYQPLQNWNLFYLFSYIFNLSHDFLAKSFKCQLNYCLLYYLSL